ncbi:hypothetical protein [Bordetella sp. LUAb4]|uniref:hypothetical protein n=1 Tax=Bordetella sp. LUAb4 TaxID=2843195 RepID=UPI001E40A7E6|nr:hypothetical protein [Bordetella sp. LUAb4]
MTRAKSIRVAGRHLDRWTVGLALLGFFCLTVSLRWWLIGRYGNPVPFWDQWDAEAVRLYQPFVSGRLTWAEMLAPHNEHRIFTTRLLALGLFVLNGAWNPLLEMAVNAILLAGTLVMLSGFLAKSLKSGSRIAICGFLLALYAVPYASENTLAGFQAQFYFNLLFSFLALWLLTTRAAFSAGWLGGVFASAAAYFSLASGIFALAAAVPIMVLQATGSFLRARRQPPHETNDATPEPDPRLCLRLLAIVLLSILFVAGYFYTPQLASHADLKAHSLTEFVSALLRELAWPHVVRLRHILLMNLPLLLMCVMVCQPRARPISRGTWFLLALMAWVAGQMVTLAYGRAATVLAPRYLDLLSISVVLNFTCLLWCAQAMQAKPRKGAYVVCFLWVCYVAFGIYQGRHEIGNSVLDKQRYSILEQANVSGYLTTGDRGYLYDKPLMDIPYPDPGRLQMLLDEPGIRKLLPAAVLPPLEAQLHSGVLDDSLLWMLAHSWLVAVLGASALAWSCVLWMRNRTVRGSRPLTQEM